MSSRAKRDKRRGYNAVLESHIETLAEDKHICPECGEKGAYHWVSTEMMTLDHLISGRQTMGFWICPKFYDPETKRRIDP